jgi:hypothetical protein
MYMGFLSAIVGVSIALAASAGASAGGSSSESWRSSSRIDTPLAKALPTAIFRRYRITATVETTHTEETQQRTSTDKPFQLTERERQHSEWRAAGSWLVGIEPRTRGLLFRRGKARLSAKSRSYSLVRESDRARPLLGNPPCFGTLTETMTRPAHLTAILAPEEGAHLSLQRSRKSLDQGKIHWSVPEAVCKDKKGNEYRLPGGSGDSFIKADLYANVDTKGRHFRHARSFTIRDTIRAPTAGIDSPLKKEAINHTTIVKITFTQLNG